MFLNLIFYFSNSNEMSEFRYPIESIVHRHIKRNWSLSKNPYIDILFLSFKLCWDRSGLAEFCSLWDSSCKLAYPFWTLVVNWLVSSLFKSPTQTLVPNSYFLLLLLLLIFSYQKKRFLILPPNFEFLASVCQHFSILRTLASHYFINHNNYTTPCEFFHTSVSWWLFIEV